MLVSITLVVYWGGPWVKGLAIIGFYIQGKEFFVVGPKGKHTLYQIEENVLEFENSKTLKRSIAVKLRPP